VRSIAKGRKMQRAVPSTGCVVRYMPADKAAILVS
jgi:hypothetical protein